MSTDDEEGIESDVSDELISNASDEEEEEETLWQILIQLADEAKER